MAHAQYAVVENSVHITIMDLGHSSGCLTVTNDVDFVVKEMFDKLKGRRFYYVDSEGNTDEIIYNKETGKFLGFGPGPS